MNNKVYLKKFDVKAQKSVFLGYSDRSKAYRVYNSETKMVEESVHVKFYDKRPNHDTSEPFESFADMQVSEEHPEVGSSEVRIQKSEVQKLLNQKLVMCLKLFQKWRIQKHPKMVQKCLHNPISPSNIKILIQKI